MKNYILFMVALCSVFCATAQTYKITTFAGNGGYSPLGNGGPATASGIGIAYDITSDTTGNIYMAGTMLATIRKIDTNGIIDVFAGNSTIGFGGDGGPATNAQFYRITGIATDKRGNLFVGNAADYTDDMHTIRRIDASGTITLYAGSTTAYGFSGDGGPASAALLHGVGRMITDDNNNLYFFDRGNKRIRKIDTSGTISTVVGNGTTTYAGDGSPATATGFNQVVCFTVDPMGNIYLACPGLNIIYKVNTAGIISTIAGDGVAPPPIGPFYFYGDGGPATNARFYWINDIAADRNGNLFVLDPDRLRVIDAAGIIKKIAGQDYGGGYSGDGGPARYAEMSAPIELHIDRDGILYIGENNNQVVRRLEFMNWEPTFEAGSFISLASCIGGSTFALDTILRVHDADSADTLVWTPISSPTHGTLTAAYTTGSNTGTVYPSGLSYTATSGYTGADSFLVQLFDGYEYDTIKVRITIISPTSGITSAVPTCMGYTNNFYHSAAGGTWSSSALSVLTVNAATGAITTVSPGTSVITYTVYPGCYTTTTVTLNDVPAAISGTTSACVGFTTALACATSGGTWSSSNTSYATVNSAGVVSGISSGLVSISYTNPAGCSSFTLVDVYDNPPIPMGITTICAGSTTTLIDTMYFGGTWTSSDTSVAIVGSTGEVTGISAGTSTITYTSFGGCTSTTTITVLESPAAITGATDICAGSTTALANTTTGGTWSLSTTLYGTISSTGVVTATAPGYATVSYTLPNGCYAEAWLNILEAPAAITGPLSTCEGQTITLSNATPWGTWSSSDPAVAYAYPTGGYVSTSGVGTAAISYTIYNGCAATAILTVNPAPAPISGTLEVCIGTTSTLSATPAGGTWMSYDPYIATVDTTGVITGMSSGVAGIIYTTPIGCVIYETVTVNPAPASILGASTICAYTTTALYCATPGGTWSSSNPSVAAIDAATGEVSGAGAGTATITYTAATGCTTLFSMTVNPGLTAIMGMSNVCVGSTLTVWHSVTGGTWSSSNPAIGSIDASGVITGISAGSVDVTYTAPTGCYKTKVINVRDLPTITGPTTVCRGVFTNYSSSDAGATWSASGSSVSITTTGTFRGRNAGTATITCTSSYGCISTLTVTVVALPTISGSLTICAGASTTLTAPGYTGGTWLSSNSAIATIGASTGTMSGIAGGTSTISYTDTNACTATAIATVSTGPAPATLTASPTGSILVGGTQIMTPSVPGGTWNSGNTAIATVNSSGVVTGVGGGNTPISYTLTDACGSTVTTKKVVVLGLKQAPLSGAGKEGIFALYPNPTTGSITVSSEQEGTLYIYAADGRQVAAYVLEKGTNQLSLPSSLADGHYACRILTTNGTTQTVKIELVH